VDPGKYDNNSHIKMALLATLAGDTFIFFGGKTAYLRNYSPEKTLQSSQLRQGGVNQILTPKL